MSAFEDALREMAERLPDVPTTAEPTPSEPVAEPAPYWIAHAYTQRETGSYGGRDHLVTRHAIKLGRLVREPRDALCKPARKFWGLAKKGEVGKYAVTCKRCREIAEREGIIAANGKAVRS